MTRIEYRHGRAPAALDDIHTGTVAAVVTDPPYGTQGASAGYGRRQLYGGIGRTIANDTDTSELEATLPALWRVLSADSWCVLWCSPKTRAVVDALVTGAGFRAVGEVVWDKGNPGLGYTIRYQHETMVFYAKGEPARHSKPLLSLMRDTVSPPLLNRKGGNHPHQKPVKVLRRAVAFCAPKGGLVLDPFAGSASAGLACIAEGRDYLGVECDPQWWPLAEQRLAEARGESHPDAEQASLLLGGAA